MAILRYVKTPEQVAKASAENPEFMESTVYSIRCVYETDPAIHRAVLPQPLEPSEKPEVCLTFSKVAMQISPEFTFEIGSAVFGVRASYEGVPGTYLITMPMTTEQAVVPGRETFGEPKKIADIDFQREGNSVSSAVSRMGMTYLSAKGTLGKELGPREWKEYGYCFKAQPSCERDKSFDVDPILVRLEWRHTNKQVWEIDNPEIILGESPMDPVADIPIRKIVSCVFEEGSSESNGSVLRSVPGDWLLPFLHQRYDDASGEGLEIAS